MKAADTALGRPAIVLLHSSGASSRQWDTLATCLQRRHEVHAVDLHGHGRQGPWRGEAPLSMAAEMALVEPLLQRPAGVHLIGHSYGAAVALQLAAAQPSRVRSLAVFEPVLFGLLADHDPLGDGAREAFELGAWMQTLVSQGRFETAAEHFVDYWSGASSWARMPPAVRQSIASRMPVIVQHFDLLFADAPGTPQLARLTMPVLCLAGDGSTAAALSIAGLLRKLLPQACHELIPGVGHMGPITHPSLINERLLRFLGTVTARPTRPLASPA